MYRATYFRAGKLGLLRLLTLHRTSHISYRTLCLPAPSKLTPRARLTSPMNMTPTMPEASLLADDPLSNFSHLGPRIYYLPAADAESVSKTTKSDNASADSDRSRQPDLIILCSWVNAAPRHIAKYTATYLSLYPSSAQLLITTSLADMSYRPNSTQRSHLAPALSILLSAVEPPISPPNSTLTPPPRILLHVFSHGGAHTACQLALAFRAQTNGCPLPA
jgi:Eukaryotic protein of unknown function (DUF829)